MPDIIANGLEIEAGIDQALHTGMTQGVGACAGDGNPGFAQIACAPLGNSDPGERSVRGMRLKEQGALGRLRPSMSEVLHQGLPDKGRQGIGGGMSGLALWDPYAFVLPIKSIKG